MDANFRSTEPQTPKYTEKQEFNNFGVDAEPGGNEPIDARGDEVVLEALDIKESIRDLPDNEKQNIKEVKSYIESIMDARDIEKTVDGFKQTLQDVKEEFGIPDKASADKVLDRIGGIASAYRSLSFLPVKERKDAFVKLAGMEDSGEMNKYVFKLMEDYEVWN